MTHSFPARRFSDLADIAGAVGLFDGGGGAAFGAKLGADRLRVVRREAGEHALDGGEDGGGIRIGRRQGGALDDGRDRGDLEEKREEGEHGWNPMQSSPSLSRGGGPCEAWWRGKGDVARRCAATGKKDGHENAPVGACAVSAPMARGHV